MREDEPNVLEMLIKHEMAIEELYKIFAQIFKSHGGFWQNLARDEHSHAVWFEELRSNSTTSQWLLYEIQVKPQAIKTSIGYVKNQIARAKEGSLSLLQALSIARDLEGALLEQQFSKLKVSALKEIRPVLMKLAEETERHLKIIVEMLASEKGKSP